MHQGFLQCLGQFVTRGSKKQVKAESFMMAYSAVKQIPHHEGVRNDLAVIITLDQKSRSTEYITKEKITELSKLEHKEVWNFEEINATPALEKGGRAQSESLRFICREMNARMERSVILDFGAVITVSSG
eukprot:g7576.t1